MIAHPRIGQRVRLHYAAAKRPYAPHHGKTGRVIDVSRRRPLNHLVELDSGERVIVPAGHLMKEGR